MKRVLLTLSVLLVLLPSTTRADIGPKPTIDFLFTNIPQGVTITDGQFLQCADARCLTASPLDTLGPQHFSCAPTGCSSLAYGYSDFGKLVITFSDKTRTSAVFAIGAALSSVFDVRVNADDTLTAVLRSGQSVPATTSPATTMPTHSIWSNFLFAFLVTIGLELIVSALYVYVKKLPFSLIRLVVVANVISIPLFWYVNRSSGHRFFTYIVGEIIVCAGEAVIVQMLSRGRLTWKDALILSFCMNVTSLLIGDFFILLTV